MIWVFLFIWTILMTLILLILMSNTSWNNFWCYKDIWVSFKENKDNFCGFLLKWKVTFKNIIFWCWVWALIQTNHFYNLELIELKAYSPATCISIPFSSLGPFFRKISITYNLGQNCFSLKKLLSPQINVVLKGLAFENKTWPDSTLI